MLLSQFLSSDFLIKSKQDAQFHRVAYDYSAADWDGLRDHLRDIPWDDISASAAASKFWEWVQVGPDVYIPHHKYQVKPSLISLVFSCLRYYHSS